MATELPLTTKNDQQKKQEKVNCNCDLLWSQAHQFTYLRLSDKIADNEYQLINLFEARAKRIAATYARFYLETEEGGDPSKIGRYYWMGLGAFASKTVACLLDTWQLNTMYAVSKTIPQGLGQGNFWLFTDIAASHWLHNNHRENFQQGMKCGNNRNVNNLVKAVKDITYELPWADKTFDKIKNFKPSDEIIAGFEWVTTIENETDDITRQEHQLAQLITIAEHEQDNILQQLIYNDPWFSGWAWIQRRPGIKCISPSYQITFTHACDIDDKTLKSVAPDTMKVEDLKSRMKWITQVANKFHDLMIDQKDHMTQELQTMATWVKSADAPLVY